MDNQLDIKALSGHLQATGFQVANLVETWQIECDSLSDVIRVQQARIEELERVEPDVLKHVAEDAKESVRLFNLTESQQTSITSLQKQVAWLHETADRMADELMSRETTITTLQGQAEGLRKQLRRYEWSWFKPEPTACCPECGEKQAFTAERRGHTEACSLYAAIEGAALGEGE